MISAESESKYLLRVFLMTCFNLLNEIRLNLIQIRALKNFFLNKLLDLKIISNEVSNLDRQVVSELHRRVTIVC